jgi:DNA-binding NarL/FixJ family response regulator
MHRKLNVLLIGDDLGCARLFRGAAERAGLNSTMLQIEDCIDALKYLFLNYDRVDAIVIDLSRPKMIGIDTLKRIKRDITLRNIPAAVLADKTQRHEVEGLYSIGANMVVTTDNDFDIFVEIVRTSQNNLR